MRPYLIEEEFEYKGYPCVVVFTSLGYRNGYVGVPKGNPFHGYDDETESIDLELSMHGGLTYAAENPFYPIENEGLWWIGFDCAHAGDGQDLDFALQCFPDHAEELQLLRAINQRFEIFNFETVCTKEYVKDNCKGIVDQIEEYLASTR